jgi:putative ABC transport system substrate-binding protein
LDHSGKRSHYAASSASCGRLGRDHARHRLPAVYCDRYFAVAGGLICYGPNIVDEFRPAADYVDRILKGEKPADLPIQVATRYDLVINLKTAKGLGIDVSSRLLARASEVIE